MNWLKDKLRKWLGVDQNLKKIIYQQEELIELQKIIKERTEYHLDVHHRKNHGSQVILIGKYANKDFVSCYTIEDNDFKILITHCSQLEKYASRKRIDAWPSFKAVINNELSKAGY